MISDQVIEELYLTAERKRAPEVHLEIMRRIEDGAEWIWNLAEQHFPGALQIVDLYHARQHLWDLVRRLYPSDEVGQKAWMKVHQKRLLDKGRLKNW